MFLDPSNIDTRRSFTLYEACPEARCRDSQNGPISSPPALECPRCAGARGRQRAFDSLDELRSYVATPPSW